MNTCVVYYSKNGNTKTAAEYLAKKLNAKLIELIDKTKYKGVVGFLKGGMKASQNKASILYCSVYDEISKFDRVVLATPVWAGKTTPAINAVLQNSNLTGKQIYVMTTQADRDCKDEGKRRSFYKQAVEAKGGEFVDCFSLCGSPPGKPSKSLEELSAQVDAKVNIP